MNFGFTPPDPEKVLQALDDLKAAFQRAADADTGAAQPLFQSLSDTFNKVIEDGMNAAASDPNPNPGKIMRQMMPVMLELKTTLEQIQRLAQKDPRVQEAMDDLSGTIQKSVTDLLGGSLPGIGGLGFPGGFPGGLPGGNPGKNRPTFDEDAPPAPKAPKPPLPPAPKIKPRKPGNGDFNF